MDQHSETSIILGKHVKLRARTGDNKRLTLHILPILND